MNASNSIVAQMWDFDGFLTALEEWDLDELYDIALRAAHKLSHRCGFPVTVDEATWRDIQAYLTEDREAL